MILPTGYCWIWPFLGVPCVKFSGRSPKIQEYIQIMAIVIGENKFLSNRVWDTPLGNKPF